MALLPQIPASITAELLEKHYRGNVSDQFGIHFTNVGPDFVEGTMKVDERQRRTGGIMNGGVSLLLVETFGSVGACCMIDYPKQNALGIQVSANHLGIAKSGDTLTVIARPVHTGKTTHVWNVEIKNQAGKPISSGRITLLIVAGQA